MYMSSTPWTPWPHGRPRPWGQPSTMGSTLNHGVNHGVMGFMGWTHIHDLYNYGSWVDVYRYTSDLIFNAIFELIYTSTMGSTMGSTLDHGVHHGVNVYRYIDIQMWSKCTYIQAFWACFQLDSSNIGWVRGISKFIDVYRYTTRPWGQPWGHGVELFYCLLNLT